MSQNISSNPNYVHTLCIPEVSSVIFSYFESQENRKTMMLVCKAWESNATEVVKQQILSSARQDLNIKMLPFLTVTAKSVEDFCPVFRDVENARKALSVKEVHERLLNLTEKHTLSLSQPFIIDPNCYDSYLDLVDKSLKALPDAKNSLPPAEFEAISTHLHKAKNDSLTKKEDIFCGNAFIRLCKVSVEQSPYGECYNESLWNNSGICFFPIQLFNLKVQGENNQLTGLKSDGNYCFPLKGKLIEIIIDSENQERCLAPNTKAPILPMINIAPQQFYSLRLDASAPIQEPSATGETKQ